MKMDPIPAKEAVVPPKMTNEKPTNAAPCVSASTEVPVASTEVSADKSACCEMECDECGYFTDRWWEEDGRALCRDCNTECDGVCWGDDLCNVCRDEEFEDCDECGYTHPYEDKCPNEATAYRYEKWRKDE